MNIGGQASGETGMCSTLVLQGLSLTRVHTLGGVGSRL